MTRFVIVAMCAAFFLPAPAFARRPSPSLAPALAIDRYHPIAIINQGTAGGHDPNLRVGDIVIGTSAVSLGAFKTPHRLAGAGSSTLDWGPHPPIPSAAWSPEPDGARTR